MPKEQEAVIQRLSHEGRGVAPCGHQTAFIQGALPGESVVWRPLRRRRGVVEGVATTVQAGMSDERVTPSCPHFGTCGACTLQHWQHDRQVQHFERELDDQLRQIPGLTVHQLAPALQMTSPWHYRRRARLSVRHVLKKGRVILGFRELEGRFVNDMQVCHTLVKPLADLVAPLIDALNRLECPDYIPQIELAAGDDEVAVIVRHLQDNTVKDRAIWEAFAKDQGVTLYMQAKDPWQLEKCVPHTGDHILHYALSNLPLSQGQSCASTTLKMAFHPCDFIQINQEMNLAMIKQALDWLDLNDQDCVLDAFCGAGNFTLPMALRAKTVVGIEGDARLVNRGHLNAQANGLGDKVSFYEQDCYQCRGELPWLHRSYDKMLLDPPRSGAEPLLEFMGDALPSTLLYVSCHMATFMRDAALLARQGFELERAGVIDMFPHTGHIETMGLYKRRNAS